MTKWIDRMINWGFFFIPLAIGVLVFILNQFGCGVKQ